MREKYMRKTKHHSPFFLRGQWAHEWRGWFFGSHLYPLQSREAINICRIETGKFNPSIAMLKRIAHALGKKLVIKLQ